MTPLALHPEASQELRAAVQWYESERPGYGAKLFDEVERRLVQAQRFPASGAPVVGFAQEYDVRRFVVRGFPYLVVTAIVNEERLAIAIAHTSRAPGYWKARLK